MGIEPMTSPLPRECSTTELRERGQSGMSRDVITGTQQRRTPRDRIPEIPEYTTRLRRCRKAQPAL